MASWLRKNRNLLLRIIGTILAVVLIFVLMREEGWDDVVRALREISLAHLALAVLLVLVSRFFVAARWYILLRSGRVSISAGQVLALTFTGLFSNNFLPTTIGGDVVRLAGAMRLGFDRAVCLASIAADRLIGMLGMAFAVPFGLVPALQGIGGGGLQSVTVAALFQRGVAFGRKTLQTFSIWLGQPMALLGSLGCTWGHMVCTFATMYILISDLGPPVSFWLIAGLWSLSYFVTLLPISINGYGVQEFSLTFLFSTVAGLTTATSLTVALVIRALYVAVSLVGAIYMPGILAAVGKPANAGNLMD
jgi:uncharacterized membrane protein YbhN (UPF0104 family)